MDMKPTDIWVEGTEDNSIPANSNALRLEVLLGQAISKSTTAQPAFTSPADDGKFYVLPAAPTGSQWGGFSQHSIAIFKGGTWYELVPNTGLVINIAGVLELFDTTWEALSSASDAISCLAIAFSDEFTAIEAGTNLATFHLPFNFTLAEDKVMIGLTTPQTSGSVFTVDVNVNGSSILSTKATVDNTEDTNLTAAAPLVCTATTLSKGDKITVDVDQVGDGTAMGGKLYLIGYKTP